MGAEGGSRGLVVTCTQPLYWPGRGYPNEVALGLHYRVYIGIMENKLETTKGYKGIVLGIYSRGYTLRNLMNQ